MALEPPTEPTSPTPRSLSVFIEEVVDRRVFTDQAEDPSVAQLITGGQDDPAITARALGQFTTAGGSRLRDFLLPADTSVSQLVAHALTQAFREAGISVVETPEPGAIPVTAEIQRLWAWNEGSWTFSFFFESDVHITTELPPFADGETVSGNVRLRSAVGAADRSYVSTTTKGLRNFVENMRDRLLKAAPTATEEQESFQAPSPPH